MYPLCKQLRVRCYLCLVFCYVCPPTSQSPRICTTSLVRTPLPLLCLHRSGVDFLVFASIPTGDPSHVRHSRRLCRLSSCVASA